MLLARKLERQRLLRRQRRRLVDNIKMDLVVIAWHGMAWTGLVLR
jgi:hypothetical protein